MPLYYFHIHTLNGTIEDSEGGEFADMGAVREEAIAAVREMVAESVKRGDGANGRELRVADDTGKLVLAIPFREVSR